MTRHRIAVTLAFILITSALLAQSDSSAKSAAVRAVLDQQVAAWNRGDLDGYMAGYWHSPDLEFYGGDTITLGWEQTLARYKQRYQSGGHEMGQLDFAELHVHTNSSNVAWVSGRWHLKMKDGSERKGLFTVILHKMPEGWKIIHDHSS